MSRTVGRPGTPIHDSVFNYGDPVKGIYLLVMQRGVDKSTLWSRLGDPGRHREVVAPIYAEVDRATHR